VNPLVNRQKSDNGKGDVPVKRDKLEPWEAIGQGALKIAGEENELDLPLGLDLLRRIGKSDREIASQSDFDMVHRLLFPPDNKNLLAHRLHPAVRLDGHTFGRVDAGLPELRPLCGCVPF
jgi:hypothetical protein